MLSRRNLSFSPASLSAALALAVAHAASAQVSPGTLNYVLSSTPVFHTVNGAPEFDFVGGNGARTISYSGAGGDVFSYYSTNYSTGVVGEYMRNDPYGIVFNSSGVAAICNEATSPYFDLQTYLPNGTAIGPATADYIDTADTTGTSIYNLPFAAAPNAGYVVGLAMRTAQLQVTPSTFGNDAFGYNPTTGASIVTGPTGVGPMGKNYDDIYTTSYNSSTNAGIYRYAEAVDVNDNGIATGYTDFNYTSGSANGSSLYAQGRDAWVEDLTAATPTPVIVGLTGAGYTWNYTTSPYNYTNNSSTIFGINDAGTAIGYSLRYSSSYAVTVTTSLATTSDSGQDAWLYTSSLGTVQIGLTGNIYTYNQGLGAAGYIENSNVYRINANSQIAGYSTIYANSANADGNSGPEGTTKNSIGQDAWVYTPNTSSGGAVTSAGTANAFGTTVAGTYTQVGLLTSLATSPGSAPGTQSPTSAAGYVSSTGARSSFISGFNNLGQAAGVSTRYFNTLTTVYGQDPWFFNGTTTTMISPVSPTSGISYYFTNSSTGLPNATSGVSFLTDSGLVGGWTNRYLTGATTSEGQDAWVYDSTYNNGNGTFGKFFAITNPTVTTGYEKLTITYLSNSGIALGEYGSASSPTNISNTTPFVWTETGGYQPLTAILTTSLSAAGWSALDNSATTELSGLYVDPSGNIYGYGTTSGGVNALYKLTPSIPGDANNDGHVDLTDLSTVLNNFGSTTSLWANGNFDGAATIDLTDLSDVLNNFGVSSSASTVVGNSVAAAPEPACLGVLGAGAMLLMNRRRRA